MDGLTLILGTRKGLLIFERGDSEWQCKTTAFEGVPVAYADVDTRSGTLWACLDHGHWGQKLQRSKDMGATWEEAPSPAYPEDAILGGNFGGRKAEDKAPATLRYLWVFAQGGNSQPGRIYLGTEPGGLFVSDDNGDSFQLVESLWNHPSRLKQWMGGGRDEPGIHSISIDPRNSDHIHVGVSCAGVFETTDGGKTWEPKNNGLRADFLPDPQSNIGHDPHFLTHCESQPDVLWQQNHCGIFRSENGGKQWHDISEPEGPARFGFAIAADPLDPSAAWVVPAQSDERRVAFNQSLVVCRTADGGKSWTPLRRGLPQRLCFDITLRHALDYKNNCLAFGSTTGNVFYSMDRGDHWECLGNYFAPVYSVRFIK